MPLECHSGKLECHSENGNHSGRYHTITVGEIGVTDETMVVAAERWFITVVGDW